MSPTSLTKQFPSAPQLIKSHLEYPNHHKHHDLGQQIPKANRVPDEDVDVEHPSIFFWMGFVFRFKFAIILVD